MAEIKRALSLPFPTTTGLGVTAEEVKLQKAAVALSVDTSPMPQVGPTEFLNPSGSSEHLRLQVPTAANPLATVTGPLHDHLQIMDALATYQSPLSRKLDAAVLDGELDLPEARKGQMRASRMRIRAMFDFADREVIALQKQLYGLINYYSQV